MIAEVNFIRMVVKRDGVVVASYPASWGGNTVLPT
jgi:hypothetical protein